MRHPTFFSPKNLGGAASVLLHMLNLILASFWLCYCAIAAVNYDMLKSTMQKVLYQMLDRLQADFFRGKGSTGWQRVLADYLGYIDYYNNSINKCETRCQPFFYSKISEFLKVSGLYFSSCCCSLCGDTCCTHVGGALARVATPRLIFFPEIGSASLCYLTF